MSVAKKLKPSNNPQKLRNPHCWYYEDRRGITVVAELRGMYDDKYIGAVQTRIPWGKLMKSARRCIRESR